MSKQRITQKHLETLVDIINELTDSPMQPYGERIDGRCNANIGNFNLSYAYGGACLHRMHNSGGAVSCPIENCHVPKRELYEKMQAFISGLRASK
jgi:hypothetical protein